MCLASLINDFVTGQTWESLHRLLCFPKLVLRNALRKGKAHPRQAMVDVERRLKLFLAGSLEALWKEMDVSTTKRRPKTRGQALAEDSKQLTETDKRTIVGLVEEGALSKAAKHLVSRGLADSDDPDIA